MYHGKITKARKKRKFLTGREPAETGIGDVRIKHIRTKGVGSKVRLISGKYANVVHG